MTPIDLARGHGQSLLEYVLIIFFVALVVVGALALLGPTLSSIFSNASSGL
jgi:Flp pilus assembly pilin Flp